MAAQYYDSTQETRNLARQIEYFLYVDGKTSPKVREYAKRSEEDYRTFLDELREDLWKEHTEMMSDLGYDI